MSKDVPAEIGFTFEAVLEAVQDSGRGRWFLDEYKKRVSQEDSVRLLDAIRRIEGRMDGMAGHFTAAEDLAKVRQAINTTRNEIARLQPAGGELSAEGRMFAKLAELARKAMPSAAAGAPAPLPEGIEKTLQLVDAIDATVNSNVTAFPGTAAKSADRYFQQDAALFENPATPAPKLAPVAQAAPAAPVVAPVAAKPVVEKPPLGAKLTITRSSPSDAAAIVKPGAETVRASQTPAVEATAQAESQAPVAKAVSDDGQKAEAVVENLAAPQIPQAVEPAKPRIVIIRRKPEEIAEMPVPTETQKPPSVETAA